MTDPRTPQPEDGTEATQEIHQRQARAQQPPPPQEQWWSEPGAEQRPVPPRPAPRRGEPPQVWTPPDEAPPRPEPPRAEAQRPEAQRAEPPRFEPPRPDFPQDARPQGQPHHDIRPPHVPGEPPFDPRPPFEPRFEPEPLRDPRAQGEPPFAPPPGDPRALAEPPFEPQPPFEARPPRDPRAQGEVPPRPPVDPRGQGEPPRRPEPPMPPRGQRPPVPPGPPPSATEQTQLIPPIRSDAPPTPPRAAPPLAPEELTVPIPRIPARPRLDEQETELIPRIDDYDQYQDLAELEPEPEPETPAGAVEVPEPRRETGRVVVRTFGELLITAGLVVLLFVVYEVYVTDWLSAGKQANATSAMDDRWKNPSVVNNNEPQRTNQFEVGDGEGFAKVYIPAFGPDYVYTVLEGTTDQILEVGPGHYKGTAYPGQPGNFAVAGHRVGKGAPFNDIDLLESCDAILVETQTDWFVYRMLPKTDEVKDWAKGKGADGKCKGVAPQGKGGKDDPYAKTVGQEIVRPEQGEVIAPVPWRANNAVPKDKQAKLITLTTCHPRFSARQRLIVHGVLVRTQPKDPKDPKAVPAEFQTG
ncbi:class E sortase [Crossiella sp. CA-258035]|uniref:class E sortase n=1 Tax=Crossiella sp. CA-258035 TaxID=2981138 RepID=UPI0024BC4D3F|nr:class E sortase [Crossiella sp. CA-258035]WHT19538.1 class E sortase [Crossiella sp. CA-258035]